jgi:Fic family protein
MTVRPLVQRVSDRALMIFTHPGDIRGMREVAEILGCSYDLASEALEHLAALGELERVASTNKTAVYERKVS